MRANAVSSTKKKPLALGQALQAFLSSGALRRSRRRLAQLDDHILNDIGLTRAEALAEATRGVWDAPSHWLG